MAENLEELTLKWVTALVKEYDGHENFVGFLVAFYALEDIEQDMYSELWQKFRQALAENELLQKDFKAAEYEDKKAAKRGFWWWDVKNWTVDG